MFEVSGEKYVGPWIMRIFFDPNTCLKLHSFNMAGRRQSNMRSSLESVLGAEK